MNAKITRFTVTFYKVQLENLSCPVDKPRRNKATRIFIVVAESCNNNNYNNIKQKAQLLLGRR